MIQAIPPNQNCRCHADLMMVAKIKAFQGKSWETMWRKATELRLWAKGSAEAMSAGPQRSKLLANQGKLWDAKLIGG